MRMMRHGVTVVTVGTAGTVGTLVTLLALIALASCVPCATLIRDVTPARVMCDYQRVNRRSQCLEPQLG